MKCALYSPPNTVGVIKRRMKWVELVAWIAQTRKKIQTSLVEIGMGRCHIASLGIIYNYETCVCNNANWSYSELETSSRHISSLFLYDSVSQPPFFSLGIQIRIFLDLVSLIISGNKNKLWDSHYALAQEPSYILTLGTRSRPFFSR